jgi:hypothetical protein
MIPKQFATQWEKLQKFYLLAPPKPHHHLHQSRNNFSGESPLRLLCNHCSVHHFQYSCQDHLQWNEDCKRQTRQQREASHSPAPHLPHATLNYLRTTASYSRTTGFNSRPKTVTTETVTDFKHPRLQNSTKSSRVDSRIRWFKYTNVCETEAVSILRVLMSEALCAWATWRGLLAREYFTVLWVCLEYDQLGRCSAVESSLVYSSLV